ncbi:two pore domain potassium channel family protein [Pikeienuella piscinae]|uniref:Two pore domain potassium channel family protein n=1 Tax=Pikeienuella piscinae TaxID=2748098 RepID=A0A7L5BXS3_9RHOB|nr:potassium channel family protein [Pikeienuella piscinae]QIE56725.1 two pore domain potassium channel family protein [Pikeienuella piscinae]
MRLLHAYVLLYRAIYRAFLVPRVQAVLLVCTLIATAQALAFRWIEGWSFLDAFYFAIVSMATVGYGDLTPTTPLGKVLCMVFLVIGVGIFVLTVTTIAQAIMHELFEADRRSSLEGDRSETLRHDDDQQSKG